MGDWSYIGSVLAIQVDRDDSCTFSGHTYVCQQTIQWITHRVFDKVAGHSYFHYDTVENVIKAACTQAGMYAGSMFNSCLSDGSAASSVGGAAASSQTLHRPVATLAVVMIGQRFILARGTVFQ